MVKETSSGCHVLLRGWGNNGYGDILSMSRFIARLGQYRCWLDIGGASRDSDLLVAISEIIINTIKNT